MLHYNFNSVYIINKIKIVQKLLKLVSTYIRMNTIGIIAEFNPFHNGHLHLLNKCKEDLKADKCVVIMSGDFVQRGAPSVVDKFTKTKMALSCGADLVIELPLYYSLSSAEFFAKGAVSILDKSGIIDYLCFGSECGSLDVLNDIAKVLNDEPDEFKKYLNSNLKAGMSFAGAREAALLSYLEDEKIAANYHTSSDEISDIVSNPNNILALEYIRALLSRQSSIVPYTIKRSGEGYHSDEINDLSSASAIRKILLAPRMDIFDVLKGSVPAPVLSLLEEKVLSFADTDSFSSLLFYKLCLEKENGYFRYLDISEDLSNKIMNNLEDYPGFDAFCTKLKSKDIAYSRISRALFHILLNMTDEKMNSYKEDDYTGYIRILGMKKDSSDLVKKLKENSKLPVIGNLKEVNSLTLSKLQKELFDETLLASKIYSQLFIKKPVNEYRKPLILY